MTKRQITDARNQRVVKANQFIREARYSLTVRQQRLILYLISMIQREDDDFHEYEISIQDYCKICGIKHSGELYQEIEDSIRELRDKSIGWVTLENGERPLLAWLEKARWTASGFIRVRLDADLKPFLLELKSRFTSYQLVNILQFRSKYSTRLYELACSYNYRNESDGYVKTFKVDELQELLSAKYAEYRDFKRRVLNPAISEINRYTDTILTLIERRQGKRVVGLEISIRRKSGPELTEYNRTIEERFGPEQLTLWNRVSKGGSTDAGDMYKTEQDVQTI